MERFPHSDEAMEKLLQWMESSGQWVTRHGDGRVAATCVNCRRVEYFHLLAPEQFTADERRQEINERECCRGDDVA